MTGRAPRSRNWLRNPVSDGRLDLRFYIKPRLVKILVIGATGATGKEILAQAASRGESVTGLVRSAKASFGPAISRLVGDVLDRGSLERALIGQDAVICALGSALSGPFKDVTLLSRGTQNLIDAMEAHGVKRLVCITGIGAGDSMGHGPWYYNSLLQPLLLRGVYRDKTRQETVVRASRLDWTVVRPGLLNNGPGRGVEAVRAFTNLAGVRVSAISRTDVAAFCLGELGEGRYRGQAPVIAYRNEDAAVA